MSKCLEEPFAAFVRRYSGVRVYLAAYHGNAGDELIYSGALQTLMDAGAILEAEPRRAEVVVWPGGNPAMWHAHIRRWRELLNETSARFLLGPCTLQADETQWRSTLISYRERIEAVFVRDERSLAAVDAIAPELGCGARLAPDPAIHCQRLPRIMALRDAKPGGDVLAAFRDDHEAVEEKWRQRVFLLVVPRRYRFSVRNALLRRAARRRIEVRLNEHRIPATRVMDVSATCFSMFIQTIAASREVHTDRLHAMFGAVLLGRPVIAYDTYYGKLSGAWSAFRPWLDVPGDVRFV